MAAKTAKQRILSFFANRKRGVTAETVATRLGMPLRTVQNNLAAMLREETLTHTPGQGRNAGVYARVA